jgi:hypothetical protein
MIKKILALALTLIICIGAVGCSDDGTPDGMKKVSLDGEPFILYVPEGWVDNSASGISGAHYSSRDKISVSARYYTPEADMSADAYVTLLETGYASSVAQYAYISRAASVLGGQNAVELVYTFAIDTKTHTSRQLVTKHGSDLVILSFICPTETYEANLESFNEIVDAFVLCEKGEVRNDCYTDNDTPAGMKIASADNVQYRFYVPTSWICDSKSGVSEAYFPVSGKPNVSVSAYSPADVMTAEQYFALCETELRKTVDKYELLSTSDRQVAGRDAKVYVYSTVYGEKQFTIMQTVTVYNDLVYSITYTALSDSFDAYVGDVGTMVDNFIFR